MSPRAGFEAVAVVAVSESPKLTIIVPPMQRITLDNFIHVNFSPKNTRDTKKVKRLDELLKMVFDCTETSQTIRLKLEMGKWIAVAELALNVTGIP